MTARFFDLLFSQSAKAEQARRGSRNAYSRYAANACEPDRLTERETSFIAARDSFYIASVNANGWPYMQHRGGAKGFVKILSDSEIGFADFRGNRQYISVGNIADDDRVCLFFMDYPRRLRLKLLGRARSVDLSAAPALADALVDTNYKATVERGVVIAVEAFDWNCPQHITPRFSHAELAPTIEALKARIAELEAQAARATAENR